MKNNRSVKNNTNMSSLKKAYCITLENAGKRTLGHSGGRGEGWSGTVGWFRRDNDPDLQQKNTRRTR